ncbi:MAG: hypothetical protein Q8K24_09455 [Hydrogenophaga sp.]|nr:hypothetical protein [Hydrogenophaga sp.]
MQTLDAVADGIEQAAGLVQLLIAAAAETTDGTIRPALYCLADVLARAGAVLDTFSPSESGRVDAREHPRN